MANLIITVKFAPSECFCGKEEINYISTSSLLQVFSLFAPRETLFTFCKVWIGLLITVQSDLKIFSLLLTLITVKGLHVYTGIYWYTPF